MPVLFLFQNVIMAKIQIARQPVATIQGRPPVSVYGDSQSRPGTPNLEKLDDLWADGGGANPQPSDGSTFCFTLDGPTAFVGTVEYLHVAVLRTKKNWLGTPIIRQRGGWVKLSEVRHGELGDTKYFFALDEKGQVDQDIRENDEERIQREFTEQYGTEYGTPTVIQTANGYAYKFSNGKSLSVDAWAQLTEVKRRQFVDLLPLDPRTNLSVNGGTPDPNPTGLGLPNWLLYTLGGSIVLVVVVFVIKALRK